MMSHDSFILSELWCQKIRHPPRGYMTVLTQGGRAPAFLAALLLDVQDWKEWAPFTEFHSDRAPALMEIDMKKDGEYFSHTLSLLSTPRPPRGIMHTVSSESTQNLMRLFYISVIHCVLISVCMCVCVQLVHVARCHYEDKGNYSQGCVTDRWVACFSWTNSDRNTHRKQVKCDQS